MALQKALDVPSIMQDLVRKNRAYWEKQLSQVNINQFSKREMNFTSREDFVYVVQRKEQNRICFLSGQERRKKLKVAVAPPFLDPDANGIVQKISNKIRSTRGVGGFVDLETRFKDFQSSNPEPNKYDPYPSKRMKVTRFPFGKSLKEPKKILNTNPGPGYYETPKQCRRPRKEYCGRGMSLVPCVEIRCVPKPVDKCLLCQKICDADYWYYGHTFICLQCMRIERRIKIKFKISELNRFKKIRNCCFTHQHEGTTAPIYLRTKSQLQRKFRIENYLDSYFNKYV